MPEWDQMLGQCMELYGDVKLVYAVVGLVVLWIIMQAYYSKIVRQMRQEAARTAQLVGLMLQVMEGNGLAKLRRDEKGEIVGATVKTKPSSDA